MNNFVEVSKELSLREQRIYESRLYGEELQVIGILGAARSGKSTASSYLQEKLGAQPESFAAPLKAGLNAMGITYSDQVLYKQKEHPLFGRTTRHIMQTLGTEWGREMIDPDIWVKLMAMRLEGRKGIIVFDDVRFPNELDLIRDLGGITIKVRRPEVEPGYNISSWAARLYAKAKIHPSERLWMEAETDYEIFNTGTERKFKAEVFCTVAKAFKL